jgi:hypothetical protein
VIRDPTERGAPLAEVFAEALAGLIGSPAIARQETAELGARLCGEGKAPLRLLGTELNVEERPALTSLGLQS